MFRLSLAAAAAVAALAAPSAQAAPPYCVTVTDGGGTIASTCVVGSTCAVYGTVLPSTVFGFAYCVLWP